MLAIYLHDPTAMAAQFAALTTLICAFGFGVILAVEVLGWANRKRKAYARVLRMRRLASGAVCATSLVAVAPLFVSVICRYCWYCIECWLV